MKVKEDNIVPFFKRGDVGGIAYSVANNIVNYVIVIATLSGVLGWPDHIVYGRVVPGMSIGLLISGIFYAYQGYQLSKKEGRSDVTALPSGVSTPAMFVILYGVVMPLHYAIGDPELAWSAAVAATFIGGFIEFVGGFIGPWVRKKIPRAALLGTIAGIGFIWMATQGMFDVFSDPIIGLPVLAIAMFGLFGGYIFPKKIPPLIIAIVGGIAYAFLLGRTSFDFSGVGFYFPNLGETVGGLLRGFKLVVPFLTIIIPVEIYNFIETMDNVEAAQAAGDKYSTRQTQFADGICTMISAIFGGVIPNTVWLGHAGLKKSGAGIGYSVVSGLLLGAAGIFGLFTFLSGVIPPAVAGITYLWCSVVMVAQAFKACEVKHYAGIVMAMLPPVADYMYSQITNAISGVAGVSTGILESGLNGYTVEVTEKLLSGGVMWKGVTAVQPGAVLIGILLGTLTVFIIDQRLDKVGMVAIVGAILSATGFIHSAKLAINLTSPFAIGYLIVAIMSFFLHTKRGTWFKAEKDFEYV